MASEAAKAAQRMQEPESAEKLQGADIVEEVLFNMEQGQFHFEDTVLVPALYHVYLHPADFDWLQNVIAAICEQCKIALNKRLRELSKKRFGRKQIQYRIEVSDWDVGVYADFDEDAVPGGVKVKSQLAPAREQALVGTVTQRVRRAPAPTVRTEAPPSHSATSAETEEIRPGKWGTLVYRDDTGEHIFSLNEDEVTIGRGTSMSLSIRNAGEEVSRQHFRLSRRANGEAYAMDLGSANGTALDGRALSPNKEVRLPDHCRLSLANGVVNMLFTRGPG